jgi:hypothetical protein
MYEGAGLPYMVDIRFGIKNYFSMPFDTYGGMDNGDVFKAHYLAKAFMELPGIGYRYVVTYDYQVDPQLVWAGYETSKRSTQVKDITLSPDDMWRGLHKDNRTCIRNAWKSDVVVGVDEDSRGQELLIKQFPKKFLNALEYHMGRYYFPYIAMVKGKLAVASIMFVYGDTMTYWASVNTGLGRDVDANYMLLWTAIQDAHKAGCKTFNFGASPKGAESLVKFKSSWGTKTHNYEVHYIIPRPLRPIMRVREWLRS